jgi:peptide/nickel transport system substrate-binding protein
LLFPLEAVGQVPIPVKGGEKMNARLTRRHFLMFVGIGTLSAIVSSCAPTAPQPTPTAPVVELTKLLETPAAEPKTKPGSLFNKDEYESLTGVKIEQYNEAPMLADQVKAGKLPPVSERLPKNPIVAVPWNEIGQYGGTLRWDEFTVGYDHYCRHITNVQAALRDASESTYYNAGPSAPDPAKPFLFESWSQNQEATEFVLKIREGMKWSDGTEVTTEDVRFRVEDELMNEELTPQPPLWLRWNPERKGITTKVEYLDRYTFKLTFAMPYGAFVNQELREVSWGAVSNFLAPSHFYKKFHKKYTDIKEILPEMEKHGYKTEEEWANFYNAIAYANLGDSGGYYPHLYAKELPVLYPWVVSEIYPDSSVLFVRNPYFYAIDPAGNQLPYIDCLKRQFVSTKEMVNLDIIAGKVDTQGQFIRIDDYPLFKENEAKGSYRAIPVRAWQHHVLIYWVNPAVKDEKLAAAFSQFEFRKALSIALDRNHINQAVFKGLGIPAQFAPPRGTPLYSEELSNFAAEYNPEEAKKLLEDLGYRDVNGDGYREAPDGSEFVIQILYYEVTPAATPGVQLAQKYWGDIGLKVDAKQMEGLTFWQYQGANEVAMSVWWANGPDFGDGAFIGMGVNVPMWRQWYNTGGEKGVEPPDWAKRIMRIQEERLIVASDEERRRLDAEGWELLVKNLIIIGTVEGPKNPLILNSGLGNVEYGFDKNFVAPTYWEWAFQWYYKNPERRR